MKKFLHLLWFLAGVVIAEGVNHRPVTFIDTPFGTYMVSFARTTEKSGATIVLSKFDEFGKVVVSRVVHSWRDTTATTNSIYLANDSKGLVLGVTEMGTKIGEGNSIELARFSPSLEWDRTFGNEGRVSLKLSGFTDDQLAGLAVRDDGSIVLSVRSGNQERPFELEKVTLIDLDNKGDFRPGSEFHGNGFDGRKVLPGHVRARPNGILVGNDTILVSGFETLGKNLQSRPFAVSINGVVDPLTLPSRLHHFRRTHVHPITEDVFVAVDSMGKKESRLTGFALDHAKVEPVFKTDVQSGLGIPGVYKGEPVESVLHPIVSVGPGALQIFGRGRDSSAIAITQINETGKITQVKTLPGLVDESGNCKIDVSKFAAPN